MYCYTNHLQTVELNYQSSSSLDDPNWAPIVGLNLAYTYYATYAEVLHACNQSAGIPVFMGEANFEYETNGVAAGAEDGGSPPFSNAGTQQFTTPGKNSAGEADWVLVLER